MMKNFRLYSMFLLTTFSFTFTSGSNVSLTVEGGVSLVGSHCPENITLFCDGTEITSLRWRYNGNVNIISYFPDGRSTTQPDDLEFFTVELRGVQQNPILLNVANFSATLSVNLLQLSNITEISCGSSGIFRVIPVNVSIIKLSVPNVPRITMVSAEYLSGQLISVEVTWNRPDNICRSFGPTSYEVSISGLDFVRSNQLSCGGSSCMTSFNNLLGEAEQLVIYIKAGNELGTSNVSRYSTPIAHQIQEYFTPEAYSQSGQLFGRCRTGVGETIQSRECIIQYTTDSMYQNLSNGVVTSLDSEVLLLDFVTSRTYYLQFSVFVDSFEIIGRVSIDFSTSDGGLPHWGVAVIIIVVILIIIGLTTVTIGILLCLYKRKHNYKETIPSVKMSDSKFGYEIVVKPIFKISVKGKQMYPEYLVTVNFKNKQSSILKCYSDFENLQKEVKNSDSAPGGLVLPSKTLIMPDNQKKYNPEDIKEQQRRLLNVLNTILKTPDILKSHCTAIKHFFGTTFGILHEAILGVPDLEELEIKT